MLRKIVIFIVIMFLPYLGYCSNNGKKNVFFFYSPNCGICIKTKKELLPPLKEKYKDYLEWEYIDTSDPKGLEIFLSMASEFQIKNSVVPSVLVGNTLLVGARQIEKRLEYEINNYIRGGRTIPNFLKVDLFDVYSKFSAAAVMGSGFIDGINPCAFAVIVFFVSFLAVYGYKKREVAYIGIFYCLAVFLTYIFIGLGAFKFLYSLEGMYFFNKFFYYFVAFFCFLLGGIALYDYVKFKNTGQAEDAILRLPKFLKLRINLVIGSHMRKKPGNVSGLIVTSFVVGFLVSLLEAACTGQVYLPTIAFILKNSGLRVKAVTYLLLYNLMFILPLIGVFLLSLLGVSSKSLDAFLKKNLGRIKVLMVFVFFLLGGIILWIR